MKISFTTYRLKCTHPFGISRSSFNYYDRVFVYLEQDGLIGRGETAPSERYNESVPQILDILQKPLTLPSSVNDIDELINIFDKEYSLIKSLRAACVNAVYDWWAQKLNSSITDIIGYDTNIIEPTSYTIAIGDFNDLEEKIKEADNYSILKVKLGTEIDKKIISNIRKFTNKPIRVDANEGWNLDTAIKMINWLAEKNVELVEQPLPSDNLNDMVTLRDISPLQIVADESCHNSIDIEKLVGKFDGINIKMSKCGGIDEAVKMIRLANDLGLKVMLGCMVESSLGITAIGQIAEQADYLDLDGNLLIDNDPYRGIIINNGIPVIPNNIGNGVSLRNEYLNKYPDLK